MEAPRNHYPGRDHVAGAKPVYQLTCEGQGRGREDQVQGDGRRKGSYGSSQGPETWGAA